MASRAPSTPPELAGFEVVGPLGAGGFSDVFLYQQVLPRRVVAVKVLLSPARSEAAKAAFTSEADLMARLSTHPYIVTIHGAGVAPDGRPYFVMEYCSRPSLAERYKRQPLSVADALRTGIRLASAVETAHRAGILHRDIKPGNVLTNDFGWPALTDFGIASAVDGGPLAMPGAASGDPDSTGGTLGLSVPWSPPEMFLEDPQADARSDVFSLAATVHTVLAGRTPFEVPGGLNGAVDLISRIERGELRPLGRDDVPRTLVAVLSRGMAPRRDDRYPTAAEFGRALQRIELELGYAPTPLDIGDDPATAAEVPAHEQIAAESGDETRVRGVTTIAPQPPERESARDAPVAPGVPTRAPVAPEPADPRRRRLVGVLIGALAVLALAAVTVAVVLGGGLPRPDPGPTAGGGDPAIAGGGIPSPEDGIAVPGADGSSVEFRWTNPDPQEGDLYYWARSEAPDERSVTREPTVTVTGVVPGSRVCIDVELGRAGRTSAPLRICTD